MAGSTTDAEALTRRLLRDERPAYAPWRDRCRFRKTIAAVGLPAHRSEAWRHTNVGHWLREIRNDCEGRSGPAAGASATAAEADAAARVAVSAPAGVRIADFANPEAQAIAAGHLGSTVDLAGQPLAAVNALLLERGVAVRVPPGKHGQPVRVGALAGRFQQVLVVVCAGAEVQLVEEPASYAHRFVEVVVGAGARVAHYRRQAAAQTRQCSLLGVRVAERGGYTLAQSSRGALLRRNDIEVALAADAEADLAGAWRLDGRDHLDNQVAVRHLAAGARSRQIYRGVVGGHARAALVGRIHVAPGADGTDAALSTRNLLASSTASAFAKPELTIHASDVRCAHGATVGALDEAAVFYLRSRGVGEATAREVLVGGFLREAIADPAGQALLGVAA